MRGIRYEESGGFEEHIQKVLREKTQEAFDEVFAAHANAPEGTVRSALERALEARGVPAQDVILDQAAPSIAQGQKATAV